MNAHCFQTGLWQHYNHIIGQTKPSTKPFLSAAWVVSDTYHFHSTRALCHVFNLMQILFFIRQFRKKNVPTWGKKPSHNLETTNQMSGDTTRRNFQFKQPTSTGLQWIYSNMILHNMGQQLPEAVWNLCVKWKLCLFLWGSLNGIVRRLQMMEK